MFPPLNSLKTASRGLLVLVASGALCVTGCSKKKETPPAVQPSVVVALPVTKKVTEWDEFPGRLAAVASVEVRARVSGYLENIHFQEGTEVKKGDLLFSIDPRRYAAELAQAEAELARAKSNFDLATLEAERAAELIKEQAISIEASQTRMKAKESSQASLNAAQAAVDAAKLEFEFTKVTAPIAGRVGRKMVTEGNLVTGGPNGATVLTTIVALDPIYCYFDVDERSALKYRQMAREGKRESALFARIPARMQLANEKGFPHEGQIDFVDNEISNTTGAIQARGIFKNEDRLMSPGFFARLRIPGSGEYTALLVRDSAIGSDQGKPFVYVVDSEGKVFQKHVTVGPLEDGLRIIRDGLKADERVVINGLMAIRTGVSVKVEEAPMQQVATAATTSH